MPGDSIHYTMTDRIIWPKKIFSCSSACRHPALTTLTSDPWNTTCRLHAGHFHIWCQLFAMDKLYPKTKMSLGGLIFPCPKHLSFKHPRISAFTQCWLNKHRDRNFWSAHHGDGTKIRTTETTGHAWWHFIIKWLAATGAEKMHPALLDRDWMLTVTEVQNRLLKCYC